MGEAPRLREIAQGRRDAFKVDPKAIKIEKGFNPRQYDLFENRQHLDQLKLSIAQVGVLQPLLVRWDGTQAILIDGECRLRACLELIKEGVDIKSVPVLQESGDEAQRLVLALASNTGKPLSVLESGGAYKRLERFGWSIQDIATKTGTTVAKVNEALELYSAPTDVKTLVSEGAVTPSLARQVVRKKGDSAGAELKQQVAKAKAAGKSVATRSKSDGKVAKAAKAEKTLIEEQRQVGDEIADAILADEDLKGTPYERLAKRWRRLRG